jgi:hypothetical protein
MTHTQTQKAIIIMIAIDLYIVHYANTLNPKICFYYLFILGTSFSAYPALLDGSRR